MDEQNNMVNNLSIPLLLIHIVISTHTESPLLFYVCEILHIAVSYA